MNIDSHWTDCIDIHIYPQIVLQVVNQVRLVQIMLDNPPTFNILFFCGCLNIFEDFSNLSTEKYSPTLSQTIRLNDISLSFRPLAIHWLLLELTLEVGHVAWQYPSLWKEIKFFGECSFHAHQVSREVIFLSYRVHAWEMVYFLIRIHLSQEVCRYRQVMPGDVPVFHQFLVVFSASNSSLMILFILSQLVPEYFSCYFRNNLVLCAVYIHDHPSSLIITT